MALTAGATDEEVLVEIVVIPVLMGAKPVPADVIDVVPRLRAAVAVVAAGVEKEVDATDAVVVVEGWTLAESATEVGAPRENPTQIDKSIQIITIKNNFKRKIDSK